MKKLIGAAFIALATAQGAVHSQDGAVGGIVVKSMVPHYKGTCPVVVRFEASIYDATGTKVRYHWERRSSERTSEQSRELVDGKLEVSDEFTTGRPGQAFTAIDSFHVVFERDKRRTVLTAKSTGVCTP